MTACGGGNSIAPQPPANPPLTYYTLSSSSPTVITLPAFNGFQATITVPPTTSGTGRLAFLTSMTPPGGFPTLQGRAKRAGQVAGGSRHVNGLSAVVANTALYYIYAESDAPVTLSGQPSFKITFSGSTASAPYYMAFIQSGPPPPPVWALNIDGPGGAGSPLNFTGAPGALTIQPGNYYAWAPYSASGPALASLPDSVVFLQPNQSLQALLFDVADANLTSITSNNTGAVSVTAPAPLRADDAGHYIFTLTSGTSPTSTGSITVKDENGSTATIAVQNIVTTTGPPSVTIPGLPTASIFNAGLAAGSNPNRTALAPDGKVYFTQSSGVGSIDTAGTISNYSGFASQPNAIAAGPDAAVWMTEPGAARIARVSTAAGTTGALTESAADATYGALSGGIVTGSDNNIWYAETGGFGVQSLQGTLAHHFSAGSGTHNINGMTLGQDGNIWFADSGANKIGKITPLGVVTEYAVPTANAGLTQIRVGANGYLWFGENTAKKVGAYNPATSLIQEFDVTPVGGAQAVGAGPDGSMWVSSNANLGRITPSGVLTVFATGASGLNGIVAGSDGNLYFTESTSNAIGRLSL